MRTTREEHGAGELHGRRDLLRTLWALVTQGATVLLHGPVGIGKTSLLRALISWARTSGRPHGLSPRTERLGDATAALAGAYPKAAALAVGQRVLKSRLRRAVEARPGVLLLDDVVEAGRPFKGFLKSLRGTGLGVVVAVDVDHARDHARARGFGLAHREIAVHRLHGLTMRRILADQLARRALPHALVEGDAAGLVNASEGCPGRLVAMVEHLVAPDYWHEGRIRLGLLRTDTSIALARLPRPRIASVLGLTSLEAASSVSSPMAVESADNRHP